MKHPLALITGASGGIGSAVALYLAEHGYDLALVGHTNKEALESLAEQVSAHGILVRTFLADLGKRGAAADIIDALGQEGLNVELLINNAGLSHVGLLQDTTWEEWQNIIQTNLTGAYAMCHEVLPQMIWNRHGRIINVSSVWGVCGASCEVAYSASKGGLNAFTRALAKELAPSNIQVNAIACGAIDTEMNGWMSEEDRAALENEIPAGRMGRPEEVADMVFKLARAPEYLTGQVIDLDGGWI